MQTYKNESPETEKVLARLKHWILGDPLANDQHKHQRLSKKVALAVFSSDALSSVAYATEEILLVLIAAGSVALHFSVGISVAILLLLIILVLSYTQTIKAYPSGGGAYLVSKDNLGTTASLIAAGALMTDYILTVAVSVAAGVAAVTSAVPALFPERVIIGVSVILLIMLMNLKGVKESGAIFALPTYLFIAGIFAMLAVGLVKYATGTLTPVDAVAQQDVLTSVGLFLLLRAFAAGCTALTGVEAISNGIPAFKEPESKNASITLAIMGGILAAMFIGITLLASQLHLAPVHDRTVVSMIAESVFGGRNAFYYAVQIFTMLILFLAANTGFADFPRLGYFLARDKYLPRQFAHLGERLVYSNGIIFLGVAASLLIIIFGGSVHLLIPLYAVGVFTSFTLSQSGMVVKHLRERERHWQLSLALNLLGAIATSIALAIIAVTKFLHGAWAIIIVIFLLILVFRRIHKHYARVAEQLTVRNLDKYRREVREKLFVVPVPALNRNTMHAIDFARSISNNVQCVHINTNPEDSDHLIREWKRLGLDLSLKVVDSPYRKVLEPLAEYIDEVERKNRHLDVTIVIPEFVPRHWWEHLLHNQTGLQIKTMVHFRKHTHFINVQYHLEK